MNTQSIVDELKNYIKEQGLPSLSFESIFRNYDLTTLSLGDAKEVVDRAVRASIDSQAA